MKLTRRNFGMAAAAVTATAALPNVSAAKPGTVQASAEIVLGKPDTLKLITEFPQGAKDFCGSVMGREAVLANIRRAVERAIESRFGRLEDSGGRADIGKS